MIAARRRNEDMMENVDLFEELEPEGIRVLTEEEIRSSQDFERLVLACQDSAWGVAEGLAVSLVWRITEDEESPIAQSQIEQAFAVALTEAKTRPPQAAPEAEEDLEDVEAPEPPAE